MAEKMLQLEDIWPLVQRLSSLDKMRLVERVATWFAHDLNTPAQPNHHPLDGVHSLYKIFNQVC